MFENIEALAQAIKTECGDQGYVLSNGLRRRVEFQTFGDRDEMLWEALSVELGPEYTRSIEGPPGVWVIRRVEA